MTTKVKTAKATKSIKPKPLRESANDSIQSFLKTLDGETCQDLYAMVIAQVEEPSYSAKGTRLKVRLKKRRWRGVPGEVRCLVCVATAAPVWSHLIGPPH